MSRAIIFGKTLYNGRMTAGFTQKEVADTFSISVRWYQRLEKGERMPSAELFIDLSLMFHIDIEVFREETKIFVPIYAVKGTVFST